MPDGRERPGPPRAPPRATAATSPAGTATRTSAASSQTSHGPPGRERGGLRGDIGPAVSDASAAREECELEVRVAPTGADQRALRPARAVVGAVERHPPAPLVAHAGTPAERLARRSDRERDARVVGVAPGLRGRSSGSRSPERVSMNGIAARPNVATLTSARRPSAGMVIGREHAETPGPTSRSAALGAAAAAGSAATTPSLLGRRTGDENREDHQHPERQHRDAVRLRQAPVMRSRSTGPRARPSAASCRAKRARETAPPPAAAIAPRQRRDR